MQVEDQRYSAVRMDHAVARVITIGLFESQILVKFAPHFSVAVMRGTLEVDNGSGRQRLRWIEASGKRAGSRLSAPGNALWARTRQNWLFRATVKPVKPPTTATLLPSLEQSFARVFRAPAASSPSQ